VTKRSNELRTTGDLLPRAHPVLGFFEGYDLGLGLIATLKLDFALFQRALADGEPGREGSRPKFTLIL
jgi:hypothetical protein